MEKVVGSLLACTIEATTLPDRRCAGQVRQEGGRAARRSGSAPQRAPQPGPGAPYGSAVDSPVATGDWTSDSEVLPFSGGLVSLVINRHLKLTGPGFLRITSLLQ